MKILPAALKFTARPMPKDEARYLKQRLENSKSVDIVCHELTDRDALNSARVMQNYLEQKGIEARIILSQNLDKLEVRNPNFNYIQASDFTPDKTAQTVLCVDFSRNERVNGKVLEYIKSKKDDVLCIDHHVEPNLLSQGKSLYVDNSAVSATSILYRFFESNNEEITSDDAYRMMLGMVDDGLKNGLFICDGKEGVLAATNELKKDGNAYYVFLALYKRLTDEQIKLITKKIDIMSNLKPNEQKFNDSLYSRLQFSKNGKIAYVEIPYDDPEWKKLGGDNARTSTILNRFRQDVINNKFNDDRLDNVDIALAFYEAAGDYRISAHSKDPVLEEFFKYIDKKVPYFSQNSGGHETRRGGKKADDNLTMHQWVQAIVSCDDFFE